MIRSTTASMVTPPIGSSRLSSKGHIALPAHQPMPKAIMPKAIKSMPLVIRDRSTHPLRGKSKTQRAQPACTLITNLAPLRIERHRNSMNITWARQEQEQIECQASCVRSDSFDKRQRTTAIRHRIDKPETACRTQQTNLFTKVTKLRRQCAAIILRSAVLNINKWPKIWPAA